MASWPTLTSSSPISSQKVAIDDNRVERGDYDETFRLAKREYTGSLDELIVTASWKPSPLVIVELNGTRIVDGDVSTLTDFMGGKKHPGKDRLTGHFGFAGHNDPVAFRNIRIKPVDRK